MWIIVVNILEERLNLCNKDNQNNIYTTKLIRYIIQCTPNKKGACFSFNSIITPIFEPWNVITPSTPKHRSFKVKLDFEKPLNNNKNYVINFFKLLVWEPSTTCYKVERIGSHFHPSTTYIWTKINNFLSMVVTSSQDTK